MQNRLFFISFIPESNKFRGSLSFEAFNSENNPQTLIKKAETIYSEYIRRMRIQLNHLRELRVKKISIPVLNIWEIGNLIFALKADLDKVGLQVDNLYSHLVRDLGVKRKWLEKVVILRRYISCKKLIPKNIKWGSFEHSTARKAKDLGSHK